MDPASITIINPHKEIAKTCITTSKPLVFSQVCYGLFKHGLALEHMKVIEKIHISFPG